MFILNNELLNEVFNAMYYDEIVNLYTMNDICKYTDSVTILMNLLNAHKIKSYNNDYGINLGSFHYSDDIIETFKADCYEIALFAREFCNMNNIKSYIAFLIPTFPTDIMSTSVIKLIGHCYCIVENKNGYSVFNYISNGQGRIEAIYSTTEEAAEIFGNNFFFTFLKRFKFIYNFTTYKIAFLSNNDLKIIDSIIKIKNKNLTQYDITSQLKFDNVIYTLKEAYANHLYKINNKKGKLKIENMMSISPTKEELKRFLALLKKKQMVYNPL